MRRWRGLEATPGDLGRTVVTVGMYDGVHRGHQQLIGTAAVITPVGEVKGRTGDFTVGNGEPGPLTMELRERLLDIQHGRVADTHGWLHRVAPVAS